MKRPDTGMGLKKRGNPFPARPDQTTPELRAGLSSVNQPFVQTAQVSTSKEEITSFPFGFSKCSHPVEMARALVSCLQLFWISEQFQ